MDISTEETRERDGAAVSGQGHRPQTSPTAVVDRALAQYTTAGTEAGATTCFAVRYTEQGARLLAAVDAAHEDISGPAIRHILKRDFEGYGNPSLGKRLGAISTSP